MFPTEIQVAGNWGRSLARGIFIAYRSRFKKSFLILFSWSQGPSIPV